MNIRYHVELSEAERGELAALVGGGKHYARKIKRAQILLAADSGLSDDDIAAAVAVGGSTVYRTKRRFVEVNLEAALNEEPRAGADRKLTGNEEALLVATACSSPPEGRARWTLELLAGAMVKLTDHDSLSRETVRRRLAENHLKPWQKDNRTVSWLMSIPRSASRSSTLRSDSGYLTYIITTRWMTSGELLKYRNGFNGDADHRSGLGRDTKGVICQRATERAAKNPSALPV